MNRSDFEKLYYDLAQREDPIPCVVSTSRHMGKGLILDAHWYQGLLKISLNDREIEIPYIGVERLDNEESNGDQ